MEELFFPNLFFYILYHVTKDRDISEGFCFIVVCFVLDMIVKLFTWLVDSILRFDWICIEWRGGISERRRSIERGRPGCRRGRGRRRSGRGGKRRRGRDEGGNECRRGRTLLSSTLIDLIVIRHRRDVQYRRVHHRVLLKVRLKFFFAFIATNSSCDQ